MGHEDWQRALLMHLRGDEHNRIKEYNGFIEFNDYVAGARAQGKPPTRATLEYVLNHAGVEIEQAQQTLFKK